MSRILIDMDGVMADTYAKLLDRYVDRFGHRPTEEELVGKQPHHLPDAAVIREVLFEPGFFRDLRVFPGAVEVVRELYERHEVFIVSATAEFKHGYLDKWEWLGEHFPFIHHSRIVFCGSKSVVCGDYMLDDKIRNLVGFRGQGLLFDALDNRFAEGYLRLHDWAEVRDYFRAERARQKGASA